MNKDSFLNVLAEEENISLYKVNKYYDAIKYIPCIQEDNRIHSLNCLYLLVELLKKRKQTQDFNYILSDALYKTYGDVSIPYLSNEYNLTLKKKNY